MIKSIEDIINSHTIGDPEKLLLWCSKSLRKIKIALAELGYSISHETIRTTLLDLGYSLQANKKTKEGGNHPDRDAQFEHIDAT